MYFLFGMCDWGKFEYFSNNIEIKILYDKMIHCNKSENFPSKFYGLYFKIKQALQMVLGRDHFMFGLKIIESE